jgi:hypothetical protein
VFLQIIAYASEPTLDTSCDDEALMDALLADVEGSQSSAK